MGLYGLLWSRDEVVQHKTIRYVVHQRHQEDKDYEPEKESVVGPTDTIVYPTTVVVELIDAPVAGATVLGSLTDVRLAYVTLELVVSPVEYFSIVDNRQLERMIQNRGALTILALSQNSTHHQHLPLGLDQSLLVN